MENLLVPMRPMFGSAKNHAIYIFGLIMKMLLFIIKNGFIVFQSISSPYKHLSSSMHSCRDNPLRKL